MTNTTKTKTIILISLLSSLMLILIQIFRCSLVEILTPFLEPLLEILIYGLFIATLLWAIVYLIKNNKIPGKCAIKPFLIHAITIIIVFFVPFTDILINLDFKINYTERQKIISLVESGIIKSDSSMETSLVELPSKHKHLSSGGEIVIENKSSNISILFYKYRGVLDNFSGFIYTSKAGPLEQGKFNGDYKQIIKIREHWFWVSSS